MKFTEEEKEIMAEKNYNLIHFVANKYMSTTMSYDDIVGAGQLGFVKALNTFDKDLGFQFSTYAYKCIRNEIVQELKKEQKYKSGTISFETILSEDDEGNAFRLKDLSQFQDTKKGVGSDVIGDVVYKEDVENLMKALEKLSDRDYYVACHRFGLFDKEIKTQQVIAKELNMSQANVSKIEDMLVVRLRRMLRKEYSPGLFDEFVR